MNMSFSYVISKVTNAADAFGGCFLFAQFLRGPGSAAEDTMARVAASDLDEHKTLSHVRGAIKRYWYGAIGSGVIVISALIKLFFL